MEGSNQMKKYKRGFGAVFILFMASMFVGDAAAQSYFLTERDGGRVWGLDPTTDSLTLLADVPGADGIVVENSENILVTTFYSGLLVRVNLSTGDVNTVAQGLPRPQGLTFNNAGTLFVVEEGSQSISTVDLSTGQVSPIVTGLSRPVDVVFENSDSLLVSEFFLGRIVRVNLLDGSSEVVTDQLTGPAGIFLDDSGELLVAEFYGNRVSAVDLSEGVVTPVVTGLNGPHDVASDPEGNLLIVEYFRNRVIQIDAEGSVREVASALVAPVFTVPNPLDSSSLVVELTIDIKPNSINCNGDQGGITVAVLTTEDVDATTVDHTTVVFEGARETHVDRRSGEPRRHEEDVDGDGDTDLVLHFRLGDTALTCDSTEGHLTGETLDGIVVEGRDDVTMTSKGPKVVTAGAPLE